jgi:uncharacterized protein (DUF849 family)
VLIEVCLNGSRERGEHPALPLLPQELALDARCSVDAGAGAIHIHPRHLEGAQTLAAEECGTAIEAIRATCPGILLGTTTAAWIEPDVQKRLMLIQQWQVLPDFVSVNFSEPGTQELCSVLLARSIGIEAGLATVDDTQLLLKMGISDRCVRILIEPAEERLERALVTVEAIEKILDEASIQTARLLHGFNTTAWPLLRIALQRGYDTRIGLEDTLTLPDGKQASSNAELVAIARK